MAAPTGYQNRAVPKAFFAAGTTLSRSTEKTPRVQTIHRYVLHEVVIVLERDDGMAAGIEVEAGTTAKTGDDAGRAFQPGFNFRTHCSQSCMSTRHGLR
jgi:hypothetical protein